MAAVAPLLVPHEVLPTEHTLRDSPSHVSLKPVEPGPGPVPLPVPRKSVTDAPASDVPDSGVKLGTSTIEGRSAPGSAALSTSPRSVTVASAGHTVAGSQNGSG